MKKLIQVFDYLKMPHEYQTDLAVFFEAGNDTYHRWYPHYNWDYPDPDLKAGVNTWLREVGQMEGEGDEYFYVLIRVHW